MRRLPRLFQTLLVVVAGGAVMAGAAQIGNAGPTDGTEVARKAPKIPTELPGVVVPLLESRMMRHAEDMNLLLASVVLLETELAAGAADNIASQPRIARPLPGSGADVNERIPPAFFTFQDALYKQAKGLAEAARSKDHDKMGSLFGKMTSTCVGCHALFLEPKK